MKYFAIRSELSETDWSPHLHGANNLKWANPDDSERLCKKLLFQMEW